MILRAKRSRSLVSLCTNEDDLQQRAVRWADNMAKCGCFMCANARKHDGPTFQEIKAWRERDEQDF